MRGALCPGIFAGSLISASCGGSALCKSEIVISIVPPEISSDLDTFAPGVQIDVRVTTTLLIGDVIALEVRDLDGALIGTVSRAVDAQGGASFDYVTVPTPRAVLHATGRGICGAAADQITVDVPVGDRCALEVVPAPEARAFFAPRGVLSGRTDPDPVAAGYQATVRVATQPGWTVEISAGGDGAAARLLGARIAGDDGAIELPVTLADGPIDLAARCRGGGAQLAPPPARLLVDTQPPSCALIAPEPGSVISGASDDNGDLGDGLQFAVIGHSDADDVAGEPVSLTITEWGGAPVAVPVTVTDDDGTAIDRVTVIPGDAPAIYDFAITMRDHAGNACTALASYGISRDPIAAPAPPRPPR